MGAGIGEITGWVAAHGLKEDTVLVFTSNNGMNLGWHGVWGKGNGTYPLNMYDSSAKILFIIRISECEVPGSTCSVMAGQYNILPIVLSLAGCRYELESLQPEESLLERINHPAEKYGDQIVVFDGYNKAHMIKGGSLRHIYHYGGNSYESYDLSKDPNKGTNLFGNSEFKEQARSLKTELREWFDRYSVPKMGTRIYDVVGWGQERMRCEKDIFDQPTGLYHRS